MPTAIATANSVRMALKAPMLCCVRSSKVCCTERLSNTARTAGAAFTAAQKAGRAPGST